MPVLPDHVDPDPAPEDRGQVGVGRCRLDGGELAVGEVAQLLPPEAAGRSTSAIFEPPYEQRS